MAKTRSDSILLNLPEEQQAALADWLLNGTPYHVARERVGKEFGVEVKSLSCFSAFWDEVCGPALLARRARAVKAADTIAASAAENSALDAGFFSALKQKAFELCSQPDVDPSDIAGLLAQALKLRDQDLKERDLKIRESKVALDYERYRSSVEEQKRKLLAATEAARSKGGITPETLATIEEAASLL